jgi:hypothetical protein
LLGVFWLIGKAFNFWQYADDGPEWAKKVQILFIVIFILVSAFAFFVYVKRCIYFPIKLRITGKKYLAEIYAVEKIFNEVSLKYAVDCRFTDHNGMLWEQHIKVDREEYNRFAPQKQSQLIIKKKLQPVQKDELFFPLYAPVLVGNFGRKEVVKLLKGRYESEMEYDLSRR